MSLTDTSSQLFFIILCLCIVPSLINCQIINNVNNNNNNDIITVHDIKDDNYDGSVVWNTIKDVSELLRIEEIWKNVADADDSRYNVSGGSEVSECNKQLTLFQEGIKNQELWALKLIDASSKIPSGILSGNVKDFGMYDECIALKEMKENITISGTHCMYSTSISLSDISSTNQTQIPPLSLTLSICLPAVCNADEIKTFLQMMVDFANNFLNASAIKVTSVTCSTNDPIAWTIGGIITVAFLTILLSFLLICTIVDILMKNKNIDTTKNAVMNTLIKFSWYTNGERILSTKASVDNLSSITGIRFFSMAWVVLGHTYIKPVFGSMLNYMDVADWIYSWKAVYVLIAPFAVDTFFAMSGFLMAYIFIKEMNKGRKFNIFGYYFHRYVRITPALGILILLTIYVFPRIGSGAIWQYSINGQAEKCSDYWWKILLYVQNYDSEGAMQCLGHTWYLAVDMQLFWISPIILYPLAKRPKFGIYILIIFIITSFIVPGTIAGINKYSSTLFPTTNINKIQDVMVNFYITTHTRAGPWLLGVYFGYILHANKKLPSASLMKLGWILSLIAFSFSIFTMRIFQNKSYRYNIYWEVFFGAFSRHIWAFGVCWIIYASSIGRGGSIAKFLSLPIFLPLSRLSYCIYLLHFIIQNMEAASIRTPVYFYDFGVIKDFFSDFMFCIIGAFIYSLCFESPFLVLEKLIMRRASPKKSKVHDKKLSNDVTRTDNNIHNNNNNNNINNINSINNSNNSNNNNIENLYKTSNITNAEAGIENRGYEHAED